MLSAADKIALAGLIVGAFGALCSLAVAVYVLGILRGEFNQVKSNVAAIIDALIQKAIMVQPQAAAATSEPAEARVRRSFQERKPWP